MEVEYYAVIGGLMMTCFVVGGAMVSNNYSPPELIATGNYMIAGGWVLLLVLVGFGGYAILQKVREWNIDRRYDTIDRKFEHLELKKRERELKRKEREYKEEQERKEREYRERQKKEQELKKQKEDLADDVKRQSDQSSKTVAEESTKSPAHDLKPDETFREDPLFQSGGSVPDSLKKKESPPEEQPIEKGSEQEEYVRHVKMDPILRGLWYLYISKDGFFLGQTEAARAIFEMEKDEEVSGSRREDVKASMKELEYHGLITATVVKSDFRGKKLIEYKITQKGKILMGRAIDEKVKRWIDFVEKYKFEMQG